jgi:hemolysin activation/secretion protein
MKIRTKTAAALLWLCLAPTVAWAQGGSLIIDQNRTDRAPPAPAPGKPAPSGAQAPVVATQAVIQPFVVKSIQLDGATVPARLMGPVFHPYVGQRIDGAGLTRLTQAVSDAYGRSDVALYTVFLPNQTFAGGVIRLQVVEGYIAEIDVRDEGGARKDLGLVRRMAAPALRQRPLRGSTVQRSILLIRDIPGITANVQFLRGAAPGAVVLAIGVKRKAFGLGLGINDQGTSELGRTQVEADLTANSLIRAGDQTRLTVAVPTDIQRFQYYAISHSEILNDSGLTASASFGYLRTLPKSIPVHGTAETAGVSLSYPVIRSNKQNLVATVSFDGVNSDNALFGQLLSADHTRAARVAASYNRVQGKATLAVSAAASFGVDAFGARVTSPLLSTKDFKKLNLRAAADYRITPRWTFRLRGTGQISGDRLPAVEQLPLGGAEFGRAFESAVVVGDQGLAGSAELGYMPKRLPRLINGSEVYAYADDGEVWTKDRVIIPRQTFVLASAGLGARVAVASKAVFQIEAEKALTNPLPTRSDDWRLTLSYRSLY